MRNLLPLILLAALASPAHSAGSYEILQVADGVYAALQPEAQRFNDSNSVILVNDRDVVVVDSQAKPAAVRELVAEVRKLTDKPVRYVVNTHWHGDHTQGNMVYAEEFPGVEIVGHATQIEDVAQRAAPYLADQIVQYEEGVAGAERWLEAGVKDDGTALTEEERTTLPGRIERTHLYLAALRSVEFVPPTIAVDEKLVLHRGKRRIEILHFEAHTRGDLVLYLPEEKVLVTGDLLDDLPYGGHGYPSSWIRTLDALEKLDFERVVPGHGRIQDGKAQLVAVRAMLQGVVEQVAAASAGGKTLDEVRAAVDLSASRRALAGADEIAQRVFDAWLPELVDRAYLESRGELDPDKN
jgi:glyoxylase-like metal-dependent hydrolase (beta-lactamase superfamily II)